MSDGTNELTSLLDDLLAEADNGQNMTRAAMLAERISGLYDTLRAQLSEAQERLAEIEAVCRRLVARRNSDGGYTVLTIDIESLEELLAAPVSPAAQVAQVAHGVADGYDPAAPERDPLLPAVIHMVANKGSLGGVSVAGIQRALFVGYNRAIRLHECAMLAAQQQKAGGE